MSQEWRQHCDWCGWPLKATTAEGCVWDNCSQRPLPELAEIGRARQSIRSLERDRAYLRWRLEEIIPLFQEARDALPAIQLSSAKLRGIDLTLGDRMDRAGTRTRAEWNEANP